MTQGKHSNHAKGVNHPRWNGGRTIKTSGYVLINVGPCKNRYEHTVVAENALRKRLPKGAIVHHVDGNRANNNEPNLVICQDNSYHRLIHKRQTALEESGDKQNRKCCLCHEWDNPKNLYINNKQGHARHKACSAKYALQKRRKKGIPPVNHKFYNPRNPKCRACLYWKDTSGEGTIGDCNCVSFNGKHSCRRHNTKSCCNFKVDHKRISMRCPRVGSYLNAL